MNTNKIAALYADPIFNALLRFPHIDPSTTFSKQVMNYVMRKAGARTEDGRRYEADASENRKGIKYYNDLNERTNGFLSEYLTKRQADWMLSKMTGWPETGVGNYFDGTTKEAPYLISIWGYGSDELDTETIACLRFGAEADFTEQLRALTSIRNKRRKTARKLEAQLRAYHQQQVAEAQAEEQRNLRKGQWLSAEKALTTATRVPEPGVAFLGDANLSDEQRRALDLRYWAVPEGMGMSAALPAGTGIALKVITSHKQLVDGALYLSQVSFGEPTDAHYHPVMRLGRLDKSRKQHGAIPLFEDDAPSKDLHVQAEWKPKQPGQRYEVLLMQVVYYTTRAEQPALMQVETQPARVQPRKRQPRRALAYAA